MQPQMAQVTPEEIIDLILAEMQAEIAPFKYSNVVRSVYHVYLDSESFERLRPLQCRIREEAVRALNDELSRLNKGGGRIRLPLLEPKKTPRRHEALADWVVEFHENSDDDARENPLIIHSDFAPLQAAEERAGTLTERITRRRPDGETTTTMAASSDTRRAGGVVYATLEFEDDTGSRTYEMAKDQIKVGRGAADRWVDLKLITKKDVSREHAQLRRDPGTGRFYIKDLSTLGTTVNGKPVPPSIQRVDGEETDKNIETPMPDKARIGLAGVVFINFRAVRAK